MEEPELSPRFDVDDIRKLREYNSLRHAKMTSAEVIAEIRAGAEEFLREMKAKGLKVAERCAEYSAKESKK